MRHGIITIKRAGLALLAMPILLLSTPAVSTANDLPDGPDASTYTYNEATGMWENDHYIWDPVTHKTHPKDELTYSYNTDTGMWDTTEWAYNPDSGKYEPNDKSESLVVAGGGTANEPIAAQTSNPTAASAGTSDPAVAANASPASAEGSDSTFSGFYNAGISNNFVSSSLSGDAAVTHNTLGGNATTGNATAISTIFNLLQSSTSLGDLSTVATFTTDINGNVFGDLYVDPGVLASLQPAANDGTGSNIRLSNAANNIIDNTVTVDSGSGNASVNGNTTGGNATSGNANAVLNLVNLLNSSIAAGQSFLGFININGNFNGDVLLPAGSLGALLATNSSAAQGDLDVVNNNTQIIQNNVVLNATTGSASVTNNTNGGGATTGTAATKLTALNLTGQEVIGSNSLLVFVNVLGQWVGAILSAPQGATAAAIGGGVTQQKAIAGDINIESTNTNAIQNDVTVSAWSGTATVDNNTNAGNARSGNATASANIVNISNSILSLTNWFGILFINVFGAWNGSFGLDTEAGNTPDPPSNTANDKPGAPPQVFSFLPDSRPSANNSTYRSAQELTYDNVVVAQTEDQEAEEPAQILNMTTGPKDKGRPGNLFSPTQRDINMAVSAVIAGAILVGIERVLAYRDHRRFRGGQM